MIWFLERHEQGVRTLDAALAATPLRSLPLDQRPYFGLATYYAWAGRPEKARAMLAQYDADVRDASMRLQDEPRRHGVLGEIALAEHRPLDAVREFWKADSLPDGPSSDCSFCVDVDVGRAYDLANLPDSAIAHFERFVGGLYPGRHGFDAWNLAAVRKRLGELYEAKGDTERAAANYIAFTELWKHADVALQPKVQDARTRLARLKDASGK